MEALKIWLICVAGAVCYGILHDQITVRIYPEYFTVFHPHLIDTPSLTVLAIAWGVAATWWVGAVLGIPVAFCACVGRNPALSARRLLLPIGLLLFVMGVSACCAGLIGYFLSPHSPDRFNADHYAHSASYFVGEVGGITLCLWILFTRWRLRVVQLRIDPTPGTAG